MTGVVLQARLDSSRLPDKALLPLNGSPMILRVMQALRHISCDRYILACADDCTAAFEPLAESAGFELAPGSKNDVLGRYGSAVRRFTLDRVIRATGDNAFVFADAAQAINDEAVTLQADYAGYTGLPYGAGVESVAAEALLRAEKEAAAPADREHVCPYLYQHPDQFLLHRPLAPLPWQYPQMRITVDTPADYDHAQLLYAALPDDPDARYTGRAIIRTYQTLFKAL
jgi:spore coat polysaccharide biosynthesis protein SpsF